MQTFNFFFIFSDILAKWGRWRFVPVFLADKDRENVQRLVPCRKKRTALFPRWRGVRGYLLF